MEPGPDRDAGFNGDTRFSAASQEFNASMENQGDVTRSVLAAIEDLNQQLPPTQRIPVSEDTALFGKGGGLDSIGLVNLLLLVEEQVATTFDVAITIADERAMSQKHSPFRNVRSLSEYVAQLVKEAQGE